MAFCAVEFAKTMSVITVQRNFRRQFGVDPPKKNSVKRWHTQLMETGCLFAKARAPDDRVRRKQLIESGNPSLEYLVAFRPIFTTRRTGYLEINKEKGYILFLPPLQETC
ncbi:DUF4817 domain-containing protein [Trichonephila clavipes]|nr:DUF4817 domain-containing protein [Trichonephila clavipes]